MNSHTPLLPKHIDSGGRGVFKNLLTDNQEIKALIETSSPKNNGTSRQKPFAAKMPIANKSQPMATQGNLQWPFDKVVVNDRLCQIIQSKDADIVKFWKIIAADKNAQKKFLLSLSLDISLWAMFRNRYEAKKSVLNNKIATLMQDIRRVQTHLNSSPYLSKVLNSELTRFLDTRYKAVFDEDAPSWNRWDEKPKVIEELFENLQSHLESSKTKKKAPDWYPTKLESKSVDKIFVIRCVQRAVEKTGCDITHTTMAAIASVLHPESEITETDISKNLFRKIVPQNSQ